MWLEATKQKFVSLALAFMNRFKKRANEKQQKRLGSFSSPSFLATRSLLCDPTIMAGIEWTGLQYQPMRFSKGTFGSTLTFYKDAMFS